MKHILKLLLFIIFTLNVKAQNTIKVITYNVLEGLGNEKDYGKDRHKHGVKWITEQNADVIALQELYSSEEKLSNDAKKWGHEYYAKSGPIGLTSRAPIKVKKIYSNESLRNSVLQCETYGINFFVIHLSPADWKYRLKETKIINGIIDSVKQTTDKYVLLGDFNAHSPFDAELYKQNPELIKKYQKGDKNNIIKGNPNRNLLGDYLDYSVMSSFYAFPLVDVTERLVPWYQRFTFPTPILIDVWRTAGNIGRTPERIDYILTSLPMSLLCKSVKIHNGEENDYISDHYPLEAIFDLNISNGL